MSEKIYVLKLQEGKWYVGKSGDAEKRFLEHKHGTGSKWTQRYRPIRIVETRPCKSKNDESLVTEEYMQKHGRENVRGAEYVEVVLPSFQQQSLEQKFKHVSDVCYRCGERGHYARECSRGKNNYKGDKYYEEAKDYEEDEDDICYRCNRRGHFASECYATTYVATR